MNRITYFGILVLLLVIFGSCKKADPKENLSSLQNTGLHGKIKDLYFDKTNNKLVLSGFYLFGDKENTAFPNQYYFDTKVNHINSRTDSSIKNISYSRSNSKHITLSNNKEFLVEGIFDTETVTSIGSRTYILVKQKSDSRYIKTDSIPDVILNDVIPLNDGGFIVLAGATVLKRGNTLSSRILFNPYIIKYNSEGKRVSLNILDLSKYGLYFILTSVFQKTDGGFFITGKGNSTTALINGYYFADGLFETDANFKLLPNYKVFSSNLFPDQADWYPYWYWANKILKLKNNDFVTVSQLYNKNSYDIGIRKFKANGDLLWEKFYGLDNLAEDISDAFIDADDNIVFSGILSKYAGQQTAFMGKIDSDGNQLWLKQYPYNNVKSRLLSTVFALKTTNANGSYFMAANLLDINYTNDAIMMLRINPKTGEIE